MLKTVLYTSPSSTFDNPKYIPVVSAFGSESTTLSDKLATNKCSDTVCLQ